MMFLIRVACQRAWGQVVRPICVLIDSSSAILIVTRVRLTHSATPFSCGVLGLVFSWTIPEDVKNWIKSVEKYSPPPSVQRIFNFFPDWCLDSAKKSMNESRVSLFFFIGQMVRKHE